MRLLIVNSDSGEEILKESDWPGELPRVGDIMELHSGAPTRYKVDEVDWVFEEAAVEVTEDVPLKYAKILVSIVNGTSTHVHEEVAGHELCQCGHRAEIHTPNGCKGRGGYCECNGFVKHK
jgi:hypothetical protein